MRERSTLRELNVCRQNGYYDRAGYLRCMSEDYCIPYENAQAVAGKLGPDEDFDGLEELLGMMGELM